MPDKEGAQMSVKKWGEIEDGRDELPNARDHGSG